MSMQGPSNLSNACTSMTVMEQRWKQDCQKKTPNTNLAFELRTQTFSSTHSGLRLQKKPQNQNPCFWFLSVLLFGELRLMKYKPYLKDKYRSQIHPTVVLKDDMKATCDKQVQATHRKQKICHEEAEMFLQLPLGAPLQPMLLASGIWLPVTKRLLGFEWLLAQAWPMRQPSNREAWLETQLICLPKHLTSPTA